ncbi:hypothetical protein SALBM311S_12509 [Streptomyces alboniger]
MRFTHQTLPQRVVFAAGGSPAAVAAEVEALGGTKVMLIASDREKELADPIDKEIPVVLRHEEVVMHVPVEVAERARRAAADAGADILVSVGGGSTTGLAKAMTTGLPIVAVPTTYAGSEDDVWGLTEGETKTTGVDDRVLPASVVYDAALLTTLPGGMTVASGLNAMAHCVDAMWTRRADPIDRALAQEGIRALANGLPTVASDSTSVQGIEQTLYGAYLAAVAFASAGSGMHHKICHVLGGMFNLPHAQTHAVVLPVRAGLQHRARPGGGDTDCPGVQLRGKQAPAWPPCARCWALPGRCATTACPRTASPRRWRRSSRRSRPTTPLPSPTPT